MNVLKDNEAKWRTGGEGRLDVNGVRWWACDPYPTWYRWEGRELFTNHASWADRTERGEVTWDGWHCTECDRYHGYGRIFTYGEDVLCEACNHNFRPWLEALGLEDEWKAPL